MAAKAHAKRQSDAICDTSMTPHIIYDFTEGANFGFETAVRLLEENFGLTGTVVDTSPLEKAYKQNKFKPACDTE